MNLSRTTLLVIWLLLMMVTGCGESAEILPTPTPLPTPAAPTAISQPSSLPPTPAPLPTAPLPTVPLPAPPTVIVATAEPTATTTPEPTATPLPLLLQTLDQFIPQGRNPLTGELVSDPAVLQRRPILCKISNSPPDWVRPQSGLNSADIIFEHYAEGKSTRFSALFYGQAPASIGPVRSARLIDLELPLMYDASLCFSGGSSGPAASRGVYQLLFDQSFRDRIFRTTWPGYYRTTENKPFEHTLYLRPLQAWEKLAEQGQNSAPEYATAMTFGEELPVNSAPATSLRIEYGPGMDATWQYDPAGGHWLRWSNGQPVIDALDGEQVAVSNVIVVKAPHYINYNICEFQGETRCHAFSTEIQVWGGGFAAVFRDGRQINGSWQRPDRTTNGMMLTFHDETGAAIPLKIGRSWIQFLPYDEYIATPWEVE